MHLIKGFLFFFVYYIILNGINVFSIGIEELRALATESGITSKCVDNNKSYVYIHNNQYEIYAYDDNCDKDKTLTQNNSELHDITLYKLYTCINCELAEWTRRELLKLIEPLPILYHSSFTNVYEQIFTKYIKGNNLFFNHIVTYTNRFINIILNFQNMYWDAHDTSVDIKFSMALLTLNFGVNFLNTNYNKSYFAYSTNLDMIIVRVVLKALNLIQNYTNLNCKLNSHYESNQLYGFSMNKDKNDETKITEFLTNINPLKLDTQDICTVNQMLLLDKIGNKFNHINWKTDNGIISVTVVLEKIKATQDFSLVFWYQRYILTTIMKSLFKIIMSHFIEYNFIKRDILDGFKNWMDSTKLINIPNLSLDLIECLSLLASHDERREYNEEYSLIVQIKKYIFSKPIILGIEKHSLSINKTEDIIAFLNTLSEDFKCFIKLFKYLSYKYDDITFYKNDFILSEKIKIFEQNLGSESLARVNPPLSDLEINHSNNLLASDTYQRINDLYTNEGCKLFIGLYHYFLKFLIDLNRVNPTQSYLVFQNIKAKNALYQRIRTNLDIIAEYIIEELLSGYKNFPYLKFLVNIIPLMIMRKQVLFQELNHEELKRTIYVIMTELNTYSIEYCNPPKHNFLLFNNLNFDIVPHVSNIEKLILYPIKLLKINEDKRPFLIDNYYKNILNSIKQMLNQTKEFYSYDNLIQQNWKGEKRTMRYMRNSITYATLSSSNLYAVLEVFLKLLIAIIFVEIDRLNRTVPSDNTYSYIQNNMHTMYTSLDEQQFPTKLTRVIVESKMYTGYHSVSKTEMDTKRNEIQNEFQKIGVFFKFEESNSSNIDEYSSIHQDERMSDWSNQIIKCMIIEAEKLNESMYNLEYFDHM